MGVHPFETPTAAARGLSPTFTARRFPLASCAGKETLRCCVHVRMIPHMRGAGVEPKPMPAFEINSPATPYRVAGDIFVFGVCKHVHEHVHDKKQVGADGASTCGFAWSGERDSNPQQTSPRLIPCGTIGYDTRVYQRFCRVALQPGCFVSAQTCTRMCTRLPA